MNDKNRKNKLYIIRKNFAKSNNFITDNINLRLYNININNTELSNNSTINRITTSSNNIYKTLYEREINKKINKKKYPSFSINMPNQHNIIKRIRLLNAMNNINNNFLQYNKGIKYNEFKQNNFNQGIQIYEKGIYKSIFNNNMNKNNTIFTQRNNKLFGYDNI